MEAIAVISSVAICFLIGHVLGFSYTSHNDVLAGKRPNSKNKFILFVARPTSEIKGASFIVFLLALMLWLIVFVFAAWASIILLIKFSPENFKYLVWLVFLCVFLGFKNGEYAWQKLI